MLNYEPTDHRIVLSVGRNTQVEVGTTGLFNANTGLDITDHGRMFAKCQHVSLITDKSACLPHLAFV